MADKIVVMRAGLVEQIGSPLELYKHPANVFVATFIGSSAMNMIEGELTGNTFTTKTGERVTLPIRRGWDETQVSVPVLLGIRPEHLKLSDRSDHSTVSALVV